VQVTEQQLREYYQQEATRAGPVEYHIAHILFADEAAATAAARRVVEPGADFDALMTEYAGAGALQARDLGWGNLAQMPEAFPEILQQLEDGQAAPVAVQSAYGWHVLRRIESRPFSPPTFDEVKDGARSLLIERAVGERVRALRAAARVQQTAASK
jgi:peptidyl-prolyl cis-trans isomerase C